MSASPRPSGSVVPGEARAPRSFSFIVEGEPVGDSTEDRLDDPRDIAKARAMFHLMCPDSDVFLYKVIEGQPIAKNRPRFKKGGQVYDPSAAAQEALAWKLKSLFTEERLLGNVAVGCVFYRKDRQRVDVDNLMKLFMDAATGVAWIDDSQVTAQMSVLEYDKERPRTVVVIGEHQSSMPRQAPPRRKCKMCGTEFQPLAPKTRTCSPVCWKAWKASITPPLPKQRRICEFCGKEFTPKAGNQVTCSAGRGSCQNKVQIGKRKIPCPTCGEPMNPGAKRCWKCHGDTARKVRSAKTRHVEL